MKLLPELTKLLTNKYVLYVVSVFALLLLLTFSMKKQVTNIGMFVLIALIIYQFSKNWIVILGITTILAFIFSRFHHVREGLENNSKESKQIDDITNAEPEFANAIKIVKASKNPENDEERERIKQRITNVETAKENATSINNDSSTDETSTMDINNPELNIKKRDLIEPEGVGQKIKTKKSSEHFGPRLDYGATLEESYKHLDNLLGSDAIKQLTNDTQKLMKQQQNLFTTMHQMVPVIEGAKNMLQGFNISDITGALKGLQGKSA